ncbi:hypothetical protein ACFWO4_23130, partial [Streptomyces diastaticus]
MSAPRQAEYRTRVRRARVRDPDHEIRGLHAAAGRADSVRLTGAVVSQGRTYRLAMQLSDEGGRGRVTTPGA